MNKPKKKRAPIKAPIKHSLMDECSSACAQCRETASSKLEYHHIDGDRSRSVFENLIVLCSNCHSEYSRGEKSESDALMLKRMAQCGQLPPRNDQQPSIHVGSNAGIVASNIGSVTMKVSGSKKNTPDLPGTIGANPDMRTYANYLAGRYIDWRKKSDNQLRKVGRPPKRRYVSGATHSILGEGFGITNSVFQISENRFFDWIASAQAKIDRTVWGRTNKYPNYHSWEDHLKERYG